MRSLVSTLALGFVLASSYVSAAPTPQGPESLPAVNSTDDAAPANSTDDAAPGPVESAVPEALLSVFAEADAAADDAKSGAKAANFEQMRKKYKKYIRNTLRKRKASAKCNLKKLSVRKEWGSMSKRERISYTNAVKCLYKKPARSSRGSVPGARNRLDDFVASHIQQGQNIHFDGYLFAWHRNFVSIYEKALKEECGYQGPTPYWDWTLTSSDPRQSPVFDGSETSMGGNGENIPNHGSTNVTAFGLNVLLPPGTGGGCVKQGPFTDLVVNLGVNPIIVPLNATTPPAVAAAAVAAPADAPAIAAVAAVASVAQTGAFTNATDSRVSSYRASGRFNEALNYNPRCLTRDINTFWSNQVRVSDVEFLLGCSNVDCLEKRSDGWEFDRNQKQPLLHAAGHFAVGGLQNDPLASPGDPVFFLHHGAFDRLYSIWQAQDADKRTYQVGGTRTPFNAPPSAPVTLDDSLDFGIISNSAKFRDLLSTIDGPYCYMYD